MKFNTSSVIDYILVAVPKEIADAEQYEVGVLAKTVLVVGDKSYLVAIHQSTSDTRKYTVTHWESGRAVGHGGSPEDAWENAIMRIKQAIGISGVRAVQLTFEVAGFDQPLNPLPEDKDEL